MAATACNISSTKLIDVINAKCFPEKSAVEIDSETVGSEIEIEIESEESSNVSENQTSVSTSPNSLFNENAEKPNDTEPDTSSNDPSIMKTRL
ncbi:hypothetical protein FIV31_03460 [Coxiella endosymbiont of Ornithodoros amblus]|uniref:hypothetical protein n=1 Tax=Coxiella endosymbiont of Ornithodoros amblus TaxID=1656166 RepID=UPI00244E2843|nr:hypothetical protein [Coxiella endosymbiont of Ornithodoros amblus]MBW5802639.1 hypothetical protein [Coxiella endosymbiont of Ornithodoros amblus]